MGRDSNASQHGMSVNTLMKNPIGFYSSYSQQRSFKKSCS